jgi:hypothetical protein
MKQRLERGEQTKHKAGTAGLSRNHLGWWPQVLRISPGVSENLERCDH